MNASKLDLLLGADGLRVLFQPLVELCGGANRVHYFEGLVRGPAGSTLERADVLFDYVRLRRAEVEIDRACAAAILRAGASLSRQASVALNVHASTLLHDPEFPAFLGDRLELHGLPPERLVLEIVEYAPQVDAVQLREALEALRCIGVRVALDDIGLGHSTYAMLLDLAPDYFKVGRYIVQGCHRDMRRLAVLESLLLLAARFGARVAAEGIESPDDLTAVQGVGVGLAQGFLLGEPVPAADLERVDATPAWASMAPLGLPDMADRQIVAGGRN